MSGKTISLVIWAVICLVAVSAEKALSATRFAGAYSGSFSSSCGEGSFALLAYPDGRLIFLASRSSGVLVDHRANEHADADGSFQITRFLGLDATVDATLADGVLDGDIFGPACTGTISGGKGPAEGFYRDLGGYYAGSTEGTITRTYCLDPTILWWCRVSRIVTEIVATYRGNLFSIKRADGFSYLLFERTEFTIVSSLDLDISEVKSVGDDFRIQQRYGRIGIDCRTYLLSPDSFPGGCSFGGTGYLWGGTLKLGYSASGQYQLTRIDPLPNNPPTGMDDAYTFVGPLRRTVDPDHGVLANDTDAEGDSLTAVLKTGPAQGQLTLRADGSFDYTPDRGFTGTDGFSYLTNDGFSESAPVAATITVEPARAMPWLELLLLDD